jgi:hypothetical protein
MLELTDVQARLGSLTDVFVDAHLVAANRMKKFGEAVPEAIAALNSTERANVMHGQVRQLVLVDVESRSDVRQVHWNSLLFLIGIGDDVLVRFKYLGHGRPANVHTEQQHLLERQQYDEQMWSALDESGFKDAPTLVTCGYTLDGMDIGKVSIRRDCIGREPWSFEIYGGTAVVEPMMLKGLSIDETRPARVTSKSKKRDGQTGTDDNSSGK